jgi:DNA polymerase, archaea type
MEIQLLPLDFEYKVDEEKTYVYIYGKLEDNTKIAVKYNHQPYFYVDITKINTKELEEHLKKVEVEVYGKKAKVIEFKEVERELVGKKKKFWQIFANFPQAVPELAKNLENLGLKTYEKDITFIHRFLRDKNIVPATLLDVEGEFIENPLRIPLFEAKKISQISKETIKKVKILAIDIETYAKEKVIDAIKNPILMISFSGIDEDNKTFRKVITWKHFKHSLDYLEVVDTEMDLIQRFKEIVIDYNPDIITGYFSDGFDFPYIKTRADKFKIKLDLGVNHSEMNTGKKTDFRKGETRISGILHLDVYKFIRNIFGKNLKTDSYSLDAVSWELLNHKKHDVNLDQLYHVWDNNLESLEDFCIYNMHDSDLTLKLCQKLLFDMIEFSKIIGLPIFDVIRMSSSRHIEGYIMKRGMQFNVIAPNRPNDYELNKRMGEHVQGAFVYEPTPGLYKDLVVFDFRSLYPTIISAHNIGPESFLCECCKEKKHVPERKEYWFCSSEKKFIPTVLEELILIRVALKKMIKKSKNVQDMAIFEARSYALKILANSFYGYLGFYGARWYCLECADSTTAYARNYIKKTINVAEKRGFKVVYGDSLTPERKIFVMGKKGDIKLVSIGNFVDQYSNINSYKTLAYDGDKLVFSPIKKAIRHYYKSKEKGDILKFVTTHGITKVTPQHSVYKYKEGKCILTDATSIEKGQFLVSLTNVPKTEKYFDNHIFDIANFLFGKSEQDIFLYEDNFRFSPKMGICPYCKKNVYLSTHVFNVHSNRKVVKSPKVSSNYKWIGTKSASGGRIPRYWNLTTELAWVLGYYCADGSVSDVIASSGSRKCMVSFGSQDRIKIERVKSFFDSILDDNLKIIVDYDKRINKHMYYYRIQRIPLVYLFKDGFGCGKGSLGKKVPSFIYTSEEKIRRAFVEGYLAGDGSQHKGKRYKTHFIEFDTNSKDLACGLQYLFKSLTHGVSYFGKEIKHVGWKYRLDKKNISSLRVQTAKLSHPNFCAAKIKEVKNEDYDGYVYDLEVDKYHNFVDAEGLLLVHNTDSCFFQLGNKTIKDANKFMNEINKDLPGHMELEFEGHFPRGLFVAQKSSGKGAKKKYALLADDDHIKITGFEVVRRNWSIIAKEVQEKVLNLVLHDKIDTALIYVKEIIEEVNSGKVDKKKFVMKTQITRELSAYTSIGPHVAVAKKMAESGYLISPGTVIEYIITQGNGIIRERAKTVKEAKNYDSEYYINHQILPAVSSIFAVLGYSEEDLLGKGKQKGLGDFFK